ncbi:MAG: hypothetical protein M0T72_12275 [Candidatus Dormibacteraeota bacterium]|nr:hypothetical protein [Candidatus Dormibacteraeota bacterium]
MITGLLARWFLSPRWRGSRLRSEAASLMILVGTLFGRPPPQPERPVPTMVEPGSAPAPEPDSGGERRRR